MKYVFTWIHYWNGKNYRCVLRFYSCQDFVSKKYSFHILPKRILGFVSAPIFCGSFGRIKTRIQRRLLWIICIKYGRVFLGSLRCTYINNELWFIAYHFLKFFWTKISAKRDTNMLYYPIYYLKITRQF